jgi:hypothetical protein
MGEGWVRERQVTGDGLLSAGHGMDTGQEKDGRGVGEGSERDRRWTGE